MLTCRDIADLCTDFEEGALTPGQWARFRLHLLLCAPCLEYVRQMRLTAETLRRLPTPDDVPAADRQALSRIFREWHDARED